MATHSRNKRRLARAAAIGATLTTGLLAASQAFAISPAVSCASLANATLVGDGPPVTILSAVPSTTPAPASTPYCLVKVLVPQAINIWVGLPTTWNGRWQSLGGGGYAGTVSVPTSAVDTGYAGATTDTGHGLGGFDGSFGCVNSCVGNNAANPGSPNVPLQVDFAYRSIHLMAVLGKQLVQLYYGQPQSYSYWNGCSTGGRQGLRMAQDYPADYDGILAGAPAIHWDRFQAGQIWYQVVQLIDNGGPIGGGDPNVLNAKQTLATNRAIQVCDALDGVVDGVLTDPRMCSYRAAADPWITRLGCAASDSTCLSPSEASAIDKMWQGPVSCAPNFFGITGGSCQVPATATRDLSTSPFSQRLWYPNERGTALNGLGGTTPFFIAVDQPRFWVYFDPTWNWQTLNYNNYLQFFRDTVAQVGPLMASDNPNLAPFRDRGGKVVIWHGFADQLIVPEGTIDYYKRVTETVAGGNYATVQQFARFFIAPGVGHCGGGNGPQPQNLFDAVVNWVEKGTVPDSVTATGKAFPGRSRPLCAYPKHAQYKGQGNTEDAANFECR